MAKLERPRGLTINFSPSERQYELWNALQPNRCDKCGGILEMRPNGIDAKGHTIYQATCTKCGNTDIPEQILGGGAAGGGKMGLLDSEVCTPFGFRKLRDIKVGSIITNPKTGGMQRVIYLHPIEKHPFYRVKFVDGTYFDCSEGHLWVCHESRKKTKRAKIHDIGSDKIWTTKQMFEWYERKKDGMYSGMNLIIPLSEPVQFTTGCHKPTIDPYILGALIGDGCISDCVINSGCVQFTTEDEEIKNRFIAAGYDMGVSYQKKNNKSKNFIIRNSRLVQQLRDLGIAGNKSAEHFIPKYYKLASIKDRISLMQGLIDTDGYVDKRGHIIYTSISKQLAEDVAFIVRSLGGVATITSGKSGYKHPDTGEYIECSAHYDVQIRTKINPELCGLKRKRERARYEFNGGMSELGKRIVNIEFLGIKEGRCITVDDPSGLYVVNDFTVTHNSFLGCCWLTYSCMQFTGIRMLVARKVRKTLLETTWNTLKDVLRLWGLKEGVNYSINSQTYVITFWNGSTIMAMDLTPLPSDPDFNSLGSLEITGAFVDEVSEVSEKAIEVLASRIRYKIEDTFVVGKIFMSTNPCITWVRSTFVMTDDGDPVKLAKGYRYIPFSLFDNPNEKFRMIYFNKLSKIRDKATRDRLLYGNWWFVESNKMAAYWNFDGDKHLKQGVFESRYDPLKPLILSMDFNVNPYMTCLPMQIDYDNKKVYIFPEFIGRSKDKLNNTPAFTRYIAKKLVEWGHVGGVLLTGDPAGAARSTQTEEGVNNFTIATKNFTAANLRSTTQLLSKQPAQITRLEFVNELFKTYDGWSVEIDMRCHRLTEDFIYQQKNPDGTKEKKKIQMEDGSRAERYGHASDCFDYALVYYLSPLYDKYKSGTSSIIVTVNPDEIVYNEFDY